MTLRVAIITTAEEKYHQYLCAAIAHRFEVVGVLHPSPGKARSGFVDLGAHKRSINKHGFVFHALSKLGSNKLKTFGWNLAADVAEQEQAFFPNAVADYEATVLPRAHRVENINGSEGVDLLRELKADVVVVSGGPIYRKPILESAPLILNFHSGVSPLYNGSESIFWTFVNGQPHITGGTLMVMNAGVDSGDILAHYLPAVEAGDTPGRQLMKTIQGGVNLYCRFLEHLEEGKPFVGATQGRPFHYTVSSDWSVHQNLMIERRIKRDVCKKFVRDEIVRIYWDQSDARAAKDAVRTFIAGLVYDA